MKESLENKKLFNQNLLLKDKNPFFKKKEIFEYKDILAFDIYELKDINDGFFFAFSTKKEENIKIYKYFYKKEKFEKITVLKFIKGDLWQIRIKYFYNPLNKKEYLFAFRDKKDIEIILIKKENQFETINKKDDEYLNALYNKHERVSSCQNLFDLALFEIIYNQNDKNIYIILSYFLGSSNSVCVNSYSSNNIKILSFKNEKLILIKEFVFSLHYEMNHDDIRNLFYEDKYSKKYYVLIFGYNNLQVVEIKNKYSKKYQIKNFFESENELRQFTEIIKDQNFGICTTNLYKNNYNYLYLYFQKDKSVVNFIIIDFLNRKIIKILKIKLGIFVDSILDWNNNYLIIESGKSFCIFDKRINKIISKYSNSEYLSLFKTIISVKDNFSYLFADTKDCIFLIKC